jgi:phosphoribosylformimino-5-aminoimidazole carboxamide ribotide isomerase
VRLYQGDFAQTTVYDDDPVAVARRWVDQGADRLHVVDLDGARTGKPTNIDAVLAIVQSVPIPVQLGGGLRHMEAVDAALALGVDRVILGTAAVADSDLVARLATRIGDRLIVGVDARDGMVATAGWTATAGISAVELIAHMATLGVRRIIYTDIARDGTLTEPNYAALTEIVNPHGPKVIASGGIARTEQLHRLVTLGVEGAIVGKALYAGTINLVDAIKELA